MEDKAMYIQEGSAEIFNKDHVFYNPVQQFNRDLSVIVISAFSRLYEAERKSHTKDHQSVATDNCSEQKKGGIRILEALSATGLRSIRYAKEVEGVTEVIANDLSKSAVDSIKTNVFHNKVEHVVTPNTGDAIEVMNLCKAPNKRFEVVDLDPYGCPNRFLDSAVQCVTDGGLLLVTATDMAVLAGNTPEACFVKYGSVPLKMKSCHEMALRILLKCIEGHANRYGRYIEPLLSVSADFYIRVFVRVFTSQLRCKLSMSKQSMIYQCSGCETFTLQPLCVIKSNATRKNSNSQKFCIPTGPYVNSNCHHCGHKHHLGGPIWSSPTYNEDFVKKLLDECQTEPYNNLSTHRRIFGILNVIAEELNDVPLYYSLDKMCSVLKIEIIPMLKLRSALLHAGHRVSFSHAYKNSIKTDASPRTLWDILRCWAKIHPVKESRLLEGTPTKAILSEAPLLDYNIEDIHPQANPESRKNNLARYPENPSAHWGPGTRGTIMIGDRMSKSHRNQNKKRKQDNDKSNIHDGIKQKSIKKEKL